MAEVIALEQQRFIPFFRQRISETVAEIQPRFMTSLAEIAVGIARDLGLPGRNRFLLRCPTPKSSKRRLATASLLLSITTATAST